MFRKFLKDLKSSEKKYLKRERLRCSEIITEATCKPLLKWSLCFYSLFSAWTIKQSFLNPENRMISFFRFLKKQSC